MKPQRERVSPRVNSRRTVQKKSSFFTVLLVLYTAGLGMYYVYLQSTNRQLSYSLEVKKKELTESRNRIRNINAEVEKFTAKRFIENKVQQFNLGLRMPEQRIKQVYEVTHLDHSATTENQNSANGEPQITRR